ncbi:two-component system nitrate/nitrite sensor histidine kinase NarQ [Paenibacillus forsythiae]|uniref:histidine kinase n=1 Tax=Paenibacillus forsythiae TaxID=365616 RepID=A0ABU3H1T3_9BACL|nr:histidine kinase [Paenibacillus forsythiae]MDT3424778.1 two-component system nitrate/nitrite sensor histidine kinase NarQ [Paenibacillus forsythiae]
MTYKQIKWLILTIPTITMGIWEYSRHKFLLSYISMDLGNWLAPAVVFLASILFLHPLFSLMEKNQAELNEARSLQAALQEREKISRELHDGIAQSLFLLNAQVHQIEATQNANGIPLQAFRENIHRTNTYVREAIANLRYPADPVAIPWTQAIQDLIETIKKETDLSFSVKWTLPENRLSAKEKIELLASIREALVNIRKHAEARNVRIEAQVTRNGWECLVSDDGKGFGSAPARDNRYGLKMMEDRAGMMNWLFKMERIGNETIVAIRKEDIV